LTQRAFEVFNEREKVRAKVRSITEDLVFTHPAGRKVNLNTLKWTFEEVLRKAGIEGFRFHDLRHTFPSRLGQNGIDPYSFQKLMGHTSFSTAQRYAHHFVESLRRGIESLEEPSIQRDEKISTNLDNPCPEF
jgi:site-specific recombinase XerD